MLTPLFRMLYDTLTQGALQDWYFIHFFRLKKDVRGGEGGFLTKKFVSTHAYFNI